MQWLCQTQISVVLRKSSEINNLRASIFARTDQYLTSMAQIHRWRCFSAGNPLTRTFPSVLIPCKRLSVIRLPEKKLAVVATASALLA